ncbi:uncharacterized protein LOC124667210 [Lolium rigidum]|uniref:uncharacterized protein LOC124667210 n=1 Tax=Lolium rigidum TaxID=89674 RepID=UPI001F5C4280|nr:uncharacterized protein LOC124667210 [Lolium rigidum]
MLISSSMKNIFWAVIVHKRPADLDARPCFYAWVFTIEYMDLAEQVEDFMEMGCSEVELEQTNTESSCHAVVTSGRIEATSSLKIQIGQTIVLLGYSPVNPATNSQVPL